MFWTVFETVCYVLISLAIISVLLSMVFGFICGLEETFRALSDRRDDRREKRQAKAWGAHRAAFEASERRWENR
jgi:hypothetical protein